MQKKLNLKKVKVTKLEKNRLLKVYGGTGSPPDDQKSNFIGACKPDEPTKIP